MTIPAKMLIMVTIIIVIMLVFDRRVMRDSTSAYESYAITGSVMIYLWIGCLLATVWSYLP